MLVFPVALDNITGLVPKCYSFIATSVSNLCSIVTNTSWFSFELKDPTTTATTYCFGTLKRKNEKSYTISRFQKCLFNTICFSLLITISQHSNLNIVLNCCYTKIITLLIKSSDSNQFQPIPRPHTPFVIHITAITSLKY